MCEPRHTRLQTPDPLAFWRKTSVSGRRPRARKHFYWHWPSGSRREDRPGQRRRPDCATNDYCSPVAFNDIKHLARSMPADGLEAQDAVPHAAARAGPPRPAFPGFFAGAGRPLLPSMIDYSVFSQSAAARGQLFPVPLAARQLLHLGQIRLMRRLVIVRVGGSFPGGNAAGWPESGRGFRQIAADRRA